MFKINILKVLYFNVYFWYIYIYVLLLCIFFFWGFKKIILMVYWIGDIYDYILLMCRGNIVEMSCIYNFNSYM